MLLFFVKTPELEQTMKNCKITAIYLLAVLWKKKWFFLVLFLTEDFVQDQGHRLQNKM